MECPLSQAARVEPHSRHHGASHLADSLDWSAALQAKACSPVSRYSGLTCPTTLAGSARVVQGHLAWSPVGRATGCSDGLEGSPEVLVVVVLISPLCPWERPVRDPQESPCGLAPGDVRAPSLDVVCLGSAARFGDGPRHRASIVSLTGVTPADRATGPRYWLPVRTELGCPEPARRAGPSCPAYAPAWFDSDIQLVRVGLSVSGSVFVGTITPPGGTGR